MNIYVRAAATVVGCLLLTACASHPAAIPFDRSSAGDIKTIGVLTVSMYDKPTVKLATDIGQSFGLVGVMVNDELQNARNKAFWKSIEVDKNQPQTTFADALTASLRDHGFNVKSIYFARSNAKFLTQYPPVANTQVDAYLDVIFMGVGYGYIAAGMGDSTPYRPFVRLDFRLVRASDSSVLIQDTVFYNAINGSDKIVTLAADPAYTFVDFDALQADPKEALAGMNDSLRQTANAIGNLLH